jgi:hypothetical protein
MTGLNMLPLLLLPLLWLRLDAGTSGVVVLAKTSSFAAWFNSLLRHKPDNIVKVRLLTWPPDKRRLREAGLCPPMLATCMICQNVDAPAPTPTPTPAPCQPQLVSCTAIG